MGIVNRIVNILILLLVIASTVFGFMLFQKREELRGRGDKMAEAINSVAGTLDKNSGTDYEANLQTVKLPLGELDPGGANAKKTLYHNNYLKQDGSKAINITEVLAPFKKQASDIMTQRDSLSSTLAKIADTLKLPETFAQGQFSDVAKYSDREKAIKDLIQKVQDRDEALAEQYVKSAGVIGFTLDVEKLKNLDEYETPLQEFDQKVISLKKRKDKYEKHIKYVCSILELESPELSGDEYATALSSVEDGVQTVWDDFQETKQDLADTKDKLEEANRQLENKVAELDTMTKDRNKWRSQYQKLVEDLTGLGATELTAEEVKKILILKLRGKILEINYKWDFVVVNLTNQNMMVNPANPEEKITVPLPVGSVMQIGRGSENIAQVRVVQVNETCAICDIIASPTNKVIQKGDEIFFPNKAPQLTPEGEDEELLDDEEEDFGDIL